MGKLSKIQEPTMNKMLDYKWHNAYELRARLSTMLALENMGYVERTNHLGSLFSPRNSILFRLKHGSFAA
jgi:hypothetical protein